MAHVVHIDGRRISGRGRALRTAISISAATGVPFRMTGVLADMKPPGLKVRHMAALRAVGATCAARASGAEIGSTEIYFEPGPLRAAEVKIPLPGATPISPVIEAAAIPLGLAAGASRIHLLGGTHVPGAPIAEELRDEWAATLEEADFPVSIHLRQTGFDPEGGGEILALIAGGSKPKGIERKVRGNLKSIHGYVIVSKIRGDFAERVAREARRHLRRAGVASRVDIDPRDAAGPGSCIHLAAVLADGRQVSFATIGTGTKTGEKAAREAVNALFDWVDSGAAFPPELGEQMLLPLAFARTDSVYTTSQVGGRLLAAAEIIRRFEIAEVEIAGESGRPGEVRIRPRGQASR